MRRIQNRKQRNVVWKKRVSAFRLSAGAPKFICVAIWCLFSALPSSCAALLSLIQAQTCPTRLESLSSSTKRRYGLCRPLGLHIPVAQLLADHFWFFLLIPPRCCPGLRDGRSLCSSARAAMQSP